MADRIALEAPLHGTFESVVRVIVGGIAERADFGFEAMDDLQLAIERLLAEAGPEGHVALSFEIGDRSVRTRVGPLREAQLAHALQQTEPTDGLPTLPQILDTVTSSYGVEAVAGDEIVVRLVKLAEEAP